MNILWYSPEFMIYPFAFFIILCIIAMIMKRQGWLWFSLALMMFFLFWIGLYAFLTFAKTTGWLPCIRILGNSMVGC